MQKVVPIVLVAEDYEPFRYALITTLDGKDLKSSKPSTA